MTEQVIGKGVIQLETDDSGVKKGIQQVEGDVQKSGKKAGTGWGAAFGGAVKGLGKAGVAGAVAAVGTTLVKGFGRLSQIEEAEAKLAGLGHSAANVAAIMDDALAAVKGTAFGMGDAAAQAAVLVASGIKPGKDLERTLRLVGDTATIAGTSMADMGDIFGEVAAGGKVTTDSLNRLTDRGIPALDLLADSLGKSREETAKLVKEGEVSFEQFSDAMEKGVGGAALKSGETFKGALANIGAAMSRLGASLLGGVFEQMPELFGSISAGLDKLGPSAEKAGQAIGKAFGAIGPILSDVAAALGPVVETIGSALKGVGGGLADTIQANMGTITGIFDQFVGILQGLGGIISTVLGGIVELFSGLAPSIGSAFSTIIPVFQSLVTMLNETLIPAIQQLATWLMGFLVPILTAVGAAVAAVLPFFATIASFIYEQFIPAVIAIWQAVAEKLQPAFDAISEAIISVVLPAIVQIVAKLQELWVAIEPVVMALLTLAGWILQVAAAIISWLLPPLLKLAAFLIGDIVQAVSTVIDILIKVITWIVNAGKAFANFVSGFSWAGIVSATSSAWNSVKSTISSIWDSIKSACSSAIDSIVGFFASMPSKIGSALSGLVSTVTSKFDGIVDSVRSIPDQIVGMFSGLGSRILGAIGSINIGSLIKGPQKVLDAAGFAYGGIVSTPTLGVFGEAGAEAVVPLTRPGKDAAVRKIQAEIFGGGGGGEGGGPTINIYTPSSDPSAIAMQVVNRLAV